jgi:small nuclear ribonucleoprotein D3
MSYDNKKSIPLKLVHSSEGSVLTVELKSGMLYRGTAERTEDSMNLTLRNAICTDPATNKSSKVDCVFIRGSQVVMMVLPPKSVNNRFLAHFVKGKETLVAKKRARFAAIKAKKNEKEQKDLALSAQLQLQSQLALQGRMKNMQGGPPPMMGQRPPVPPMMGMGQPPPFLGRAPMSGMPPPPVPPTGRF